MPDIATRVSSPTEHQMYERLYEQATSLSFTREELERYARMNRCNGFFVEDEASISDDSIKPKKEYNVMPKKYNKLKEWSINARALRGAIKYCVNTGTNRYTRNEFYKFKAIYDERYKLYRIWNKTTSNVVCTIKINYNDGNKIIFIRYRQNSHYAPVMADLNKRIVNYKDNRVDKYYSLPSENLGRHRGALDSAMYGVVDGKDAQMKYRQQVCKRKANTDGD